MSEAKNEASELMPLLAANWIDAKKEKPPRGVFVLCDGWHLKTMVIAAYTPDSPDDEFPWKISCGTEISEWAEDTVSQWQHLPGSLCC
jgi:hypothetical protein